MFKPGSYWIGDLCYILNENNDFDWIDVLDSTGYLKDGKHDIFDLHDKKHQIASFQTKWGDGCYQDNKGKEYGVDAGIIGLIPLESIINEDNFDGHIYEFKKEFECYSDDGVLHFGDLIIDTKGQEEEEEW